MKRPVALQILPEMAKQNVPDGWQLVRQRDYTGGENLADLPEAIKANELILAENVIISPEGWLTGPWQIDTPLFINVSGGIVLVPIAGSDKYTVYATVDDDVIQFVADILSPVPYDISAASGYEGYVLHEETATVTIRQISHGVPFHGKNYCIADTALYIANQLTFSPSPLAFGTIQVLDNKQLTITVTNPDTNTDPVTITGATVIGPNAAAFSIDGSFPQTIAPNATYTFKVVFAPTNAAAMTASLNITTNLGILQVPISGTGATMVAVSPSSYDFGAQYVGSTTMQNITLTNSGSRTVNVQALQSFLYSPVMVGAGSLTPPGSPAFRSSNLPLPATIDPGGNLVIPVSFIPATLGAFSGVLTIVCDVGTLTVALAGSGISSYTVSVDSLDLGYIDVGTTSAAKDITITNNSPDPLVISSRSVLNASGPFNTTVTGTLPATLLQGQSFTVHCSAYAYSMGNFSADLQIITSAGNITVPIVGTSIPIFSVVPIAVDFGYIHVGDYRDIDITITSNSSGQVDITSQSVVGGSGVFTVQTYWNTFLTPLQRGQSVVLHCSVHCMSVGTLNANIQLVTNKGIVNIPISAFGYSLNI